MVQLDVSLGALLSDVEQDVKHLYRPVYGDPEDKKRCRAREAARLKKVSRVSLFEVLCAKQRRSILSFFVTVQEFEERLSNRNRRFKKQRRRAGFCDFCNVEYDDYEKHIEQPNVCLSVFKWPSPLLP